MPQHHLGSTSAPPQGAATGDRGDPAPPTRGENLRPEEPPNATSPLPTATPIPTRQRTLESPVQTRERHHPLILRRTDPATDSHQDSPAQPAKPETPINYPATNPASAPAPSVPHAPLHQQGRTTTSSPRNSRAASANTGSDSTGGTPPGGHGPTDCCSDYGRSVSSHQHNRQHATGATWPGGPTGGPGSGGHRSATHITAQPTMGRPNRLPHRLQTERRQ